MMTPTLSTVEPLLKEHSEYSTFTLSDSVKEWIPRTMATQFYLSKRTTSLIKPKLVGPKVSVI